MKVHPFPGRAFMSKGDVEREFQAFAERHGFPIPNVEADGRIHRFDVFDGGRRKKNRGYYLLHADGKPNGIVGDWGDGGQQIKWSADTPEGVLIDAAEARRMREENDRRRAAEYRAAAKEARLICETAQPASDVHPYLVKKQVRAHGLLQDAEGRLVIPLYGDDGKVWTIQRIDERGGKLFHKGGRASGSRYYLGAPIERGSPVVVCEGFATAASIAEAVPDAAVVATMSVGNIKPVVQHLRRLRPDATIVIAADDDAESKGNPGIAVATDVAAAFGAAVARPALEDHVGKLDFNDMCIAAGHAAVAALIADAADRAATKHKPAANDRQRGQDDDEDDLDASEGAWRSQLLTNDGNGGLRKKCLENCILMLSHMSETRDLFVYDEFRRRIMIVQRPPWADDAWRPHELRENDISCASAFLERQGLSPGPQMTVDAIGVVARRRTINPVADYLRGLVWDNVPRLSSWLATYCGAEDNRLNQTFGRKWMISAVARALEPGCKVDCALILEGDQGLKKSTTFSTLATIDGEMFFDDQAIDFRSKESAQNLQGVWIHEMAELDGFSKADISAIKRFLTTRNDRFRPSYARLPADHPRQFVLCGTINPDGNGYLRDPTGGRRFWPVRVHRKVDINALAQDRAQLWAEAFAAYAAGEAWWIEDAEVEKMAAAAQAERAEVDPMAAAVERFLADRCMSEATDAEPHAFSTKEIILDALHLETRDVNTTNNRRVATIMRKLGWEQGGQERGGTRRGERLWRAGEAWTKRQEEAKAADAEKAKQAAARAAERAAQWTASREQKAAPPARGASFKPDERASVTRDDTDPPDDGGVGFDVFDDFDVDDPLV